MKNESQLYKTIGEKITEYRKKQNMTQTALSISAGLQRTSITHIEKGIQKVPLDKLYKIAECLNITIFDLIPKTYQESSFDALSMKYLNEAERKEILKKIVK